MEDKQHKNNYRKLIITLTLSFFVMYAVMFVNVARLDHIYLSLNRLYMALIMVSPMALIMIGMMKHMYTNRKMNRIIVLGSTIVLFLSLVALRTQAFISDDEYMRGMIPHHSSAVMTSTHANIVNPAVRQLADSIISSQLREIEEMKELLKK